jgi:NAD(P)-dependent dehydrogenase (short-subunit alcohol dehydrogenase family)
MAMFQQKVAFITGATSGIGRAAAAAFGREGARVVLVGRRSEEGEAAAAEIRALGGEATFVPADVTVEEEVREAVRAARETFGGIDIAFNNAGTWTPSPFATVTSDLWRREIDTNLTSVYLSMKHEIPAMEERGGGTIINNASVLGLVGVGAGLAPYVAAKHGVVGLGRATALEYATSGIRINTIAPAGVDTPHYRATFGAAEESHDVFVGMHPVGRLASAAEVASLVLYLASEDAAFFSGAAVAMDGAWSAR